MPRKTATDEPNPVSSIAHRLWSPIAVLKYNRISVQAFWITQLSSSPLSGDNSCSNRTVAQTTIKNIDAPFAWIYRNNQPPFRRVSYKTALEAVRALLKHTAFTTQQVRLKFIYFDALKEPVKTEMQVILLPFLENDTNVPIFVYFSFKFSDVMGFNICVVTRFHRILRKQQFASLSTYFKFV